MQAGRSRGCSGPLLQWLEAGHKAALLQLSLFHGFSEDQASAVLDDEPHAMATVRVRGRWWW